MGGRIIIEVAGGLAVGLPNESQEEDFNPHNRTAICVLVLCTVISLVGFLSVLPWNRMWRSHELQRATRLANTGLKKKHIKELPSIVYSKLRSEPNLGDCPICLAEFVEGESIRVLPKCKHTFHIECVDRWLVSHSSCPTCRDCLLQMRNQTQSSNSEACVEQIEAPRPAAEGDSDRILFAFGRVSIVI
ncbi:hypothetical protein SUGI_0802840 [Cryptomeria japonica]|uniref:RING-H2 finger protein ATL74 n=1 Tax=Cryptomeria japonica TaxID=3369 RepID=UPI002414786D|nr:RING-H2 finger protein ATL74 [Cryptomeria japonica]GLJ39330.1 hypothetical protein SUGI_0802840 [Cryptomeria japonica]